MKIIKTILLMILASAALCLALYLNLSNYDYVEHQSFQPDLLITELVSDEPRVLDIAAAIISKEGKLDAETAIDYAGWIYKAAEKYSLDPILIMSIISVESMFNHKASSLGNYGLMQISYRYHKDKITKDKLLDAKHNIMAGARIMNEYAAKTPTQMLIRYNGSEHKHSYAQKVLTRYKKFQKQINASTYIKLQ